MHDFDSHALVRISHLIKSHAIELDGFCILASFEVDVAHVDTESTSITEHSILGDHLETISYVCVSKKVQQKEIAFQHTVYVFKASVYISLAAYWLAKLNKTLKVKSRL